MEISDLSGSFGEVIDGSLCKLIDQSVPKHACIHLLILTIGELMSLEHSLQWLRVSSFCIDLALETWMLDWLV
jgi:hypothetical protein